MELGRLPELLAQHHLLFIPHLLQVQTQLVVAFLHFLKHSFYIDHLMVELSSQQMVTQTMNKQLVRQEDISVINQVKVFKLVQVQL